jgi:type IV pilus assembly protein PilV
LSIYEREKLMIRRRNIYSSNKSKTKQKGMTFIEVLIALVIMVTGILGAVALQATAKKGSFDAMQRSLASSLAEDMISRMRANDPATLAAYDAINYGGNNYPEPLERCLTNTAGCTALEMLANDQYEWELALMGGNVTLSGSNIGGLVGATGCINVAVNTITVVVSWQGREDMSDGLKDACGTAGAKRRQVVVQAFII